jgi:hypothetical protein
MPQWLSIASGSDAVAIIVAAVIFLAIWPYIQARPLKKRFVEQGDLADNSANWSGGGSSSECGHSDVSPHDCGMDGASH